MEVIHETPESGGNATTLADEKLSQVVYFTGQIASLAGGIAVGIHTGKKAIKKHGQGWGIAAGIGWGLLTNLAGSAATIFAANIADNS